MHIIETWASTLPPKLRHRGIGIRVIMLKTGTPPKWPPRQASESEAVATPIVRQAPPPPGMGKLVDKTA